jgi:hypothetical protein
MFSGKNPDQLIYVAEAEISRAEHKVANTEPPWDGKLLCLCGCAYVNVCEPGYHVSRQSQGSVALSRYVMTSHSRNAASLASLNQPPTEPVQRLRI